MDEFVSLYDDLNRLHQIVWHFRAKHGNLWVWPGAMDCFRYVEDEAVEARDRFRRSVLNHLRNNEPGDDVADELADVLMMAASTAPDVGEWAEIAGKAIRAAARLSPGQIQRAPDLPALGAYDLLVDLTGEARRCFAWDDPEYRNHLAAAVALALRLLRDNGGDPLPAVRARLERIRQKVERRAAQAG